MSILNETYAMSTVNWWMVVLGSVLFVCGIVMCEISSKSKAKSSLLFAITFVASVILVTSGLFVGISCRDPEFQYPVGKKQIEAVFPMGKPSAFILDKYDVIEQRGRIWVMEEK